MATEEELLDKPSSRIQMDLTQEESLMLHYLRREMSSSRRLARQLGEVRAVFGQGGGAAVAVEPTLIKTNDVVRRMLEFSTYIVAKQLDGHKFQTEKDGQVENVPSFL